MKNLIRLTNAIPVSLLVVFCAMSCTNGVKEPLSTIEQAATHQETQVALYKIPIPEELREAGANIFSIPVLKIPNTHQDTSPFIGYRIYCSKKDELEILLSGLGFSLDLYLGLDLAFEEPDDPDDPAVQEFNKLRMELQPILKCPSDQLLPNGQPRLVDIPRLYVSQIDGITKYFVRYKDNSSFRNHFIEVGCLGALTGIGLNPTDAVETDVESLLDELPESEIKDISCKNGEAILDPFVQDCEESLATFSWDDEYVFYYVLLNEWEGIQAQNCMKLYKELKKNSELVLNGLYLPTVEPLKYLPHLIRLEIADNVYIENMTPLASLTKLVSLRAKNNNISNLAALRSLQMLTHLELSSNQIDDISALNELRRLKELNLSDNPINSIKSLSGILNLRNLDISGTQISDLTPLKQMRWLISLEADWDEVDPALCPVDALSEILANHCREMNDQLIVECRDALATGPSDPRYPVYQALLGLDQVDSCSELSEKAHVFKSLELRNQDIRDVSPLRFLVNLKELDLSYNDITDITSLATLRRLETLRLDHNRELADIAVIEKFVVLETLDISYTSVGNIQSLRYLTELGSFFHAGTPVEFSGCPVDAISHTVKQLCISLIPAPEISVSSLTNLVYRNEEIVPIVIDVFVPHGSHLLHLEENDCIVWELVDEEWIQVEPWLALENRQLHGEVPAIYPMEKCQATIFATGQNGKRSAKTVVEFVFGNRATKLSVGDDHSCIVGDNGRIRCWGRNQYGQLGYGHLESIGDDEYPYSAGDVEIGTIDYREGVLDGVAIDIEAGRHRTCAITILGKMICWGKNDYGQLGYGHKHTIGDSERPIDVGFVQLKFEEKLVSMTLGTNHTCVLYESGSVQCWGDNKIGQLGYGHHDTYGDDENEIPASLEMIDLEGSVESIAAGMTHTCALLTSGDVRCWGRNSSGAIGYGEIGLIVGGYKNPILSYPFVPIGGIVRNIKTKCSHTCVVLDTGRVRCWGRNFAGQLGYGHVDDIGDDETPLEYDTDVNLLDYTHEMSLGCSSSCALFNDGHVQCWGHNFTGQLGYGHRKNVGDDEDEFPANEGYAQLDVKASRVAAGSHHTCILVSDENDKEHGQVVCWGSYTYGANGANKKNGCLFASGSCQVKIWNAYLSELGD